MPSEPESFIPPRQSLVELLRDLARHAVRYLRDLAKLAGAEAGEKVRYVRILVASLVIAAAFGVLGFFFLTVALIAAIAFGLNSWGWGAFIVGIAYCIIAGLVMIPAVQTLSRGALRLDKTVRRLKEDSLWIKHKLAA